MTLAEQAFSYEAVDATGAALKGVVRAPNAAAAKARVTAGGAWLTELTPAPPAHASRDALSLPRAVLLSQLLADLLESGLSVRAALRVLHDGSDQRIKRLAAETIEAVSHGESLSTALHHLGALPPDAVALVRSGEAAGALGASIRSASDLLGARLARRRAVMNALAYPSLLLVSCGVALAILVWFVLPRLTGMLVDLGQELPPLTRAVVSITRLAERAALPAAVLALLAGGALVTWTRTPSGRATWHAFLARLPLMGGVRRALASARVTGTLGALLAHGLPMRKALALAAECADDAIAERALATASEAVSRGDRPSDAMGRAGVLSPQAASLLRAGEESGRLAEMATRASMLDATWVERRVALAVRLLEPALILAFAGVVGVFAAAMLQAVYAIRPGH